MNIAIIEDNTDYVELLKFYMKEYKWEMEFFSSSEDFGKADLKNYDVIIADYVLPYSTNGRDLLRSIQSKTPAELFLMSANPESFIDDDIHDVNINGFIDKENVQNIIDTLKYCDAKIRINRLIQSEYSKFDYMVSNGFSIEMRSDVMIIKISDALSDNSKQKIMEKISSFKIDKIIIAYPKTGNDILRSVDLGVIVSLFNNFKKNKIKMAMWNINKNPSIAHQLNLCKMDLLFRIFDSIEECIDSFNIEPITIK